MNDYVFMCFKTKKANYVYDRSTNTLFRASDNDFEELTKVFNGELPENQSSVILRYQQMGLMRRNSIKELKHPETDYLEHILDHRLEELILQVTQQCNLRCGYCVYSGIYQDNRVHADNNMSYEVAKQAIDFYMQRVDELSEMCFAFYGGEPLLRFDLIQQCVEYIESHNNGHKIRYIMTTNGTLLTDTIVDFLVKHNFNLSISLDGPKKEHDINRRFRSGGGSFDIIMKNVRRIKERYPEYEKKISFLTVMNPKNDSDKVFEYFETDEVMQDKYIMFNPMAESGLKIAQHYSDNYTILRDYEYLKMLSAMLKKIDRKDVSKMMQPAEEVIRQFGQKLNYHLILPQKFQRGGPCLAGSRRLFVSVNGDFYPCERVNETSQFCNIGSISKGLDIEKISQFINIGKITEAKCIRCWNLPFCAMCFGQMEPKDKDCPVSHDVLDHCPRQKRITFQNMYEYAVLTELGYHPLNRGEAHE